MLTADHVDARTRDGELFLRKLDAKALRDAHDLAASFLEDTRANVGHTRDELDEAWSTHDVGARAKLAAGLQKLIDDDCTWEEELPHDPVLLRAALFTRAAEARRSGVFDRDVLVRHVASETNIEPATLEKLLFADRRGQNVLTSAPGHLTADALVERYEMARAQAILLRASKVTCDVEASSPGLLRAFFAKLKFHGLLFAVERLSETSFRVVLDGPFSMFESVTKYGLKLALVLPALRVLERWTLEADVRWGKTRQAVVFRLASPAAKKAKTSSTEHGVRDEASATSDVHLADDVRTLLRDLRVAGGSSASPWSVDVASVVLDVPGSGVVIPDLVLQREGRGPVYVELLGFWSRDAVWRRVELAKSGALGARVVFCANARLRVSEAVLEGGDEAALYVWKGKPSARALLERVERLAAPASSA